MPTHTQNFEFDAYNIIFRAFLHAPDYSDFSYLHLFSAYTPLVSQKLQLLFSMNWQVRGMNSRSDISYVI